MHGRVTGAQSVDGRVLVDVQVGDQRLGFEVPADKAHRFPVGREVEVLIRPMSRGKRG